MYVCICNALDEDDIKRDGPCTLAGTSCGSCLDDVELILAGHGMAKDKEGSLEGEESKIEV